MQPDREIFLILPPKKIIVILLIMRKILAFFTVLVLITRCARPDVQPPTPLLPVPTPEQMAWHEMEMNVFVHFTTNTFTGKEWGYGDESPAVFNPSETKVKQWVDVFKKTGFKAVILTAKHHDGFCLWPSKFTEHSIKNSPYKNGHGDIVRELSDACKENGLKFGIYLSPWDRNHAEYGFPAYVTYYRNQLKELVENYGPVTEIWFDGANGGDGFYGGAREKRKIDPLTYYGWDSTVKMVQAIEPAAIFFGDWGPGVRWVGNEQGIAGETNWNMIFQDSVRVWKEGITARYLNEGFENGTVWRPAETDVSIRPGWFYHAEEDQKVKTPEQLFDIYLTSVGRGSTLLLNVPPDRRGQVHENDVASLAGFRKMLDSEFKTNLVQGSKVAASTFRGNSKQFSPDKVIDGNRETYWATDDAVTIGWLEFGFNEPIKVKYLLLQEYIILGQRVKAFKAEVWENDGWRTLAEATTIGYKRILKITPVETQKIRITILDSKACPVISNVEIY